MRAQRRAFLTILGLAGLACHNLFEVESPLRIPATELNNPAFAPVLVKSAIGDFECAFGDYVASAGNVTDEFYGSAPVIANNQWDLRRSAALVLENGGCAQIRGTPVGRVYTPLQIARYQADDTYARIQAWADAGQTFPTGPGKAALLATLAAYAGYAYTLFGEGFCQSAFDLGPPLTWRDVLDTAERRFTTALGLDTVPGDSIRSMALVGRARVRLGLGKLPEAAADAKLVPAGYVKYATFSSDSPRRLNQAYVWNYGSAWSTVDARFRNLTVGTVPDPRVPAVDAGRNGQDNRTRLWLSGKYPTEVSSIAIATWDEAQLIIAEAEGGQSAVDRINALRAKHALPVFASTDSATIAQQVREERRRQMFLEGHRLGDLLRDNIPDSLQFDRGVNAKGQAYGDMTCFPLPRVETDNNPHCAGGQCGGTTRGP